MLDIDMVSCYASCTLKIHQTVSAAYAGEKAEVVARFHRLARYPVYYYQEADQ